MKWVYLAAIPFSSGSWPVFQVHARIGNSDLHLHPGFSVLLCVSETMVLLGGPKEPLDGLFPLLIQLLHPKGMADVLVPKGVLSCHRSFHGNRLHLLYDVPVTIRLLGYI